MLCCFYRCCSCFHIHKCQAPLPFPCEMLKKPLIQQVFFLILVLCSMQQKFNYVLLQQSVEIVLSPSLLLTTPLKKCFSCILLLTTSGNVLFSSISVKNPLSTHYSKITIFVKEVHTMSPNKSLQKVQKVRKDEKVRQTKTCKYPFNLTSFFDGF